MPIKKLTPESAIDDYIATFIERKTRAVIRNLNYIGERCINAIKSYSANALSGKPNYTDRSGNLRESCGYITVVDGVIADTFGFKGEGGKEGEEFAKQLAVKYPEGVCLIVVAGKNYAFAVSTGKRKTKSGRYYQVREFDVLDGAELLAEELINKLPGLKKL
jgi:hypothetical protein